MKQLLLLSLLLSLVACQPKDTNTAPVVNAGEDLIEMDVDNNGIESVQLNGSAIDSENNIIGYQVIHNDKVVFNGIDASVFKKSLELPVGSHKVTLIATDLQGLSGIDSLIIEVKAPEVNTAPVVNAGADFSVIDSDGNGSQIVKLQGSATDKENNIVKYRVHKNGATYAGGTVPFIFIQEISLPVGSHTMTFEATDAAGLVGSDTVVITVKKPEISNTAPKVDAGPDLSLVDSSGNGAVSVKLAGSASDAENNITEFRVFRNGSLLLSGDYVSLLASTISLPIGTHTIKMDAKDAGGLMGEDSVVINVTAAPNTAPIVKAGADIARTDSDNNGSEMITLAGSASDAENNISSYRVLRNGTQILSGSSASIFTQSISVPVGSHTIVLEATDARGLKGSDSMMVNIAAAPTPPPSENTPPIANAGPDISMENTDYGISVAKIKLYGSATAGSNPIVRYVWKVNGVRVLSDSSPAILTGQEVFFIKGNNLLTLEVTDSAGLIGIDQAIVEVKPSLMDKPYGKSTVAGLYSISSGGQRIAIDHDGNGFETVRMVGSITSVNPIVSYKWLWRGQVMASGTTPDVMTANITMPIGQFNLTLEAVDSAGNVMRDGFNLQVTSPVREQVARIPSNFNTADYLVNSWYSGPSHWKDNSAFRFNCKASHYLYDDPIVFPGQKGKSHLHMFFGNTLANADSTYDSLRTSGDGTCDGGPLNRSAYWMPALVNENGKVVVPDHITIYYKKHPGTNRLPRGLRMIFGFNHSQPNFDGKHWKCSSGGGQFNSIPEVTCPATENGNHTLMVALATPKCWDGVNLDSPDHRSHMAFPKYNNYGEATCPATHPVTLPVFTMLVSWSHTGYDQYSKWRLSSDHTMPHDSSSERLPAGSSMHADWFGAWDDEVMDKWHEGCMDGFKSCSGGALGTGKQLKRNPGFSWTTVPNIIDAPAKPISP